MYKLTLTILLISLVVISVFSQENGSPTAKTYFEQGMRFMRENSLEQALSAFERSAVLDANQSATFANMGSVLIHLNRYEKAEAAFRNAITLDPENGGFHSQLCRALSLQRRHAEAIKECEAGVRIDPGSESASIALFIAMRQGGRPSGDLLAFLDSAAARFRDSEAILAMAADHQLAIRNYEYSAELLKRLLILKPDAAGYYGRLAEVNLKLERDAEALAAARKALELDPNNIYANYGMGLIFFELGQHEESIASFSKVGRSEPALNYARYYQALSESRRGNRSAETDMLRELANEFPENFEFVYALARSLNDRSLYEEAEPVFLRANDLKANDPQVKAGLGMSYMMRGKFDKAIPYFEEALRLKPEQEFYKMFIGVARGRQNAVSNLKAMEEAVESDQRSLKARVDLVRVLIFANRVNEAEKHLQWIYETNPDDYMLFHVLAVALSEVGLKDKAMFAYKKAIEKGEYAGSYFGIASIYSERGKFELASAAFAKGIEKKPDTPNFMKMYGDLLLHNGKRREALELYKRSLSLLPTNAPALYDAAVVSAKLGDRDGALTYQNMLRAVDPAMARKLERCFILFR